MGVTDALDILAMSKEEVAEFISEQRQAKTLSGLMKRLNHLALNGDASAVDTARSALSHMGFPETA